MAADPTNPLDTAPAEILGDPAPRQNVDDDLFDFAGEPPRSKRSLDDEPEESAEEPEAAESPAPAPRLRRRIVLRRAQPEKRRWKGALVGAFLVVHLSVLAAVLFHFAPTPIRIPEGDGSRAIPPAVATPKPETHDAPPAHATTLAAVGPADPRGRERMETADLLYARGVFHDARRHYFELLLAPPPGNDGLALERKARLRIAQTLAREGAPALSPIKLLADEPASSPVNDAAKGDAKEDGR